MYNVTNYSDYRIVNVTATVGGNILGDLVRAVIAGKAAPANALPTGELLRVDILPSASLEVRDIFTGDAMAITTKLSLPVLDAMDKITVKNAATVSVELFYGARL